MTGVSFHGASDDTVVVTVDATDGHDVTEVEAIDDRAIFLIESDRGGCEVALIYGMTDHDGEATWGAGVSMLDEGVAIPWPVTISQAAANGYSVLVSIDFGDDAPAVTRSDQ